jgi:tetratricopeptide (TPR) repeat protein
MYPWVRAHTTSANTNSELRSALGRGYLQAGQLNQAEAHFAAITVDTNAPVTTKALNATFLASARRDWEAVGMLLRELVEQDDANYAVHHRHRRRAAAWHGCYESWERTPMNFFFQAVNNLAVALLGQGKLKEGIEVLEAALETSPSTLAMAEPFVFNLCACFFRTLIHI